MNRTTGLALAGVGLFLLFLPLTLGKPGLPTGLKADEAGYYSMALSLAYDRDLRFDTRDVDRLFEQFHFRQTKNLIVMSDDGWSSVFFGKPYVYSFFAAPFARLFGANGMVFFNMLMTVGMIALGVIYLRRFNDDGISALFSAGFFLLSVGFSYVFWLQPEVFSMFFVTLALFLGLSHGDQNRTEAPSSWALLFSGAALALPVYNKPMFLALALPIVLPHLLTRTVFARRIRPIVSWTAGLVLSLGLLCGICWLLTGHPSQYFGSGVHRQGVEVCEPGVLPAQVVAAREKANRIQAAAAAAPTDDLEVSPRAEARNWSWLLRIPPFRPAEFAENIGYFLFGRHTGLLLYSPLVGVAVAFFFFAGHRSRERWLLLIGLGSVALWFLLWISWNWQGGGGFVGNRYFINVVPGFLFLVTRIAPRGLVVAGFALAGLFIGPMVLSPFGLPVPSPTLQAHTRNFPLRHFPLELTLRNVPGYQTQTLDGGRLIARSDQVVLIDGGFRAAGATTTRILLLTQEPLGATVIKVRGYAPQTQVKIRLGDAQARLSLSGDQSERIELRPERPDHRRSRGGLRWNVYHLKVTTDTGAVTHWTRYRPPGACLYYDHNESTEESFYAGVEIQILGPAEYLEQDLYSVQWGRVDVPGQMIAGQEHEITTRVANRSQVEWRSRGAARVNLSYHWLDEQGRLVLMDGLRTPLVDPVPSGGFANQPQRVRAPEQPGRYVLEIDPVFEHVAWFSSRNGGRSHRVAVEVVAP